MTDVRLRSGFWKCIKLLVIDTNKTVIKNSENDSNGVNTAEQNFNNF